MYLKSSRGFWAAADMIALILTDLNPHFSAGGGTLNRVLLGGSYLAETWTGKRHSRRPVHERLSSSGGAVTVSRSLGEASSANFSASR